MNWFQKQAAAFRLQFQLAHVANTWRSTQKRHDEIKTESHIIKKGMMERGETITIADEAKIDQKQYKYEKDHFKDLGNMMDQAKDTMFKLDEDLQGIEFDSEHQLPHKAGKRYMEILPDSYKGSGIGSWLGRLFSGRMFSPGFHAERDNNGESTFASFQRNVETCLYDHKEMIEACDDVDKLTKQRERQLEDLDEYRTNVERARIQKEEFEKEKRAREIAAEEEREREKAEWEEQARAREKAKESEWEKIEEEERTLPRETFIKNALEKEIEKGKMGNAVLAGFAGNLVCGMSAREAYEAANSVSRARIPYWQTLVAKQIDKEVGGDEPSKKAEYILKRAQRELDNGRLKPVEKETPSPAVSEAEASKPSTDVEKQEQSELIDIATLTMDANMGKTAEDKNPAISTAQPAAEKTPIQKSEPAATMDKGGMGMG